MWFSPPPPPPTPPRLPIIQGFVSNRAVVAPGEPVELIWSVEGCETVRLDPPGQDVPAHGRMKVHPTTRTVYWLTATSLMGGEMRPLTIEVQPPPTPMPPGPRPNPGPEAVEPGGVWIQCAAFRKRSRAEALALKLADRTGRVPLIQEARLPNGLVVARVRLGPYAKVPEALRVLHQLAPQLNELGAKAFVTVH